jgi:hypothetical protein
VVIQKSYFVVKSVNNSDGISDNYPKKICNKVFIYLALTIATKNNIKIARVSADDTILVTGFPRKSNVSPNDCNNNCIANRANAPAA